MLWMYIERATEPVLSIRLMLVLLGSVDGCLTRRSMHIDNNAACLKVFFFLLLKSCMIMGVAGSFRYSVSSLLGLYSISLDSFEILQMLKYCLNGGYFSW